MTREREISQKALEQPSIEARPAFLVQATAGDPKLKAAVKPETGEIIKHDRLEGAIDNT